MPRPKLSARFFAWTLALASLIVAPSARAQEAKAEAKPAQAIDNLNLVPLDAPVVILFRPAALLKMPDLKALYEELTRPDEVKRIVDVAEPETVEEITLVLMNRDLKLGGDPSQQLAESGAVIVRTNKAREWKALAAAASLPVVKKTHAGKEYYGVSGDVPVAFGFYQPDEMTLVVGSEPILRKIIEGRKAGGDEKPRRAAAVKSSTTLAAAAIDFAWVRGLVGPAIESEKGAALSLAIVRPIWEKTNDVVVRLDAGEGGKVTLTADHLCADEDSAKRVEKTFEAILTLGQNIAPEALKTLRQESKGDPKAAAVADLADQAIKSATVEREGTRVRVKVSVKADVAKLARMMHGR